MVLVESDVVFWHDMVEGSGASLADETGNGHTGTIINSPTWDSSDKPSAAAYSLSLTKSSSQRVNVNASAATNVGAPTESYSFSIWVKCPAANVAGGIMGRYLTKYPLYVDFSGTTGKIISALYDGSANPFSLGPTDLQDDTWKHIVVVRKGSATKTVTVYVNGAVYTSYTDTTTVSMSESTATYFGYNPGTAQYLTGRIWQTIQFNKDLSAAEVAEIYNGGAGITYSGLFAPAATGPTDDVKALFFGGGI